MKLRLLILTFALLYVLAGQMQTALGQAPEPASPAQYLDTEYPTLIVPTYCVGPDTANLCDAAHEYPVSGLQSALNAASTNNGGATVVLNSTSTFTGTFHLPNRPTNATGWIIIRTSDMDGIPGEGMRVTLANAEAMPNIEVSTPVTAIDTETGAHHYRLVGLEVRLATNAVDNYNALVTVGSGVDTDGDALPSNITIDRCYIHGTDNVHLKRGIALNGKSTAVINSYVSKCHAKIYESTAIMGWNGPGPFKIVNNYLEASGENLMFGGDKPRITMHGNVANGSGNVPSDIEIRGNNFYKPLSWRQSRMWLVKNLLELKNAQRVLIDGNVLENNWDNSLGGGNEVCQPDSNPLNCGQGGGAVVFTVRSEDAAQSYAVVQDVQFINNRVLHAAGGISILGHNDGYPSQQAKRFSIRNNLFDDINASKWGRLEDPRSSNDNLFGIVSGTTEDGPADVHIVHNTAFNTGNIAPVVRVSSKHAEIDGDDCNSPTYARMPGFIFTDNIITHNDNHSQAGGVVGDCKDIGYDTISKYFPGVVFDRNVLMGGDAGKYSSYVNDNKFPVDWAEVRFVSMATGNYSLASDSPYKNLDDSTIPNKDPGANLSLLTLQPIDPPYPPVGTVLRINAGGLQSVVNGVTWLADNYYLSGRPAAPSNVSTVDIENTTDDVLYRTERYGGNDSVNQLRYAIPVQNGSYTVRLHFAEIYWCVGTNPCPNGGTGARVFDVNVEGTQVLNDYDIIERTGEPLHAIVEVFQTTVNDTILNIDAIASVDNAKISAIEVIGSNPPPPGFWTDLVGVDVNSTNGLTKRMDTTAGWNAGAYSTQTLSGDGYVEFSTGEISTGKVLGLSDNVTGQNFTGIKYAISLGAANQARIYENGQVKGTFSGPYSTTDIYRVSIEGGVVKYYKNGVVYPSYVGSVPLTHSLRVDTSIYNPGATITNVVFFSKLSWADLVGVTVNSTNGLTKDINGTAGWNAGAYSTQTLTGDGYVEFSTGEISTGKVLGLSDNVTGQNFTAIKYAISLGAGNIVRIYENGIVKGTFAGPYTTTDRYRVSIEGTSVKYYKNGVAHPSYMGSVSSTPSLRVDTSIYNPGATITDVVISGAWN